MRVLFVAALAAGISTSAFGGEEMMFKGDGLTVRLTLAPCEVPQIAAGLIAAETQTPPRAAWVTANDIELRGCWGTTEDKVLIGDESGAGGFIPMTAFKRSETI